MNRRRILAAAVAPLALRAVPLALASTAFAATPRREGPMGGTTQRTVECNGIRLNIAERGEGPLVLLVHGFPETWYSWRHQIAALADAGFHVVAPDLRGFGMSEAPQAIDQYTILHLVGDMVGILDALGTASAVIVGHDWGASIAWQAALARPDRFRAVAALSVPFRPRGKAPPTTLMPRTETAQFYQLYFQEPGPAEAELGRDPRATLRNMLFGASGDGAAAAAGKSVPNLGMVPRGGGFLQGPGAPATLPSWISERDVDAYGEAFRRSGFRGGLNYYRNLDRNWEITAALAGLKVTVPALYIAGDRDFVLTFPGTDQVIAGMRSHVPGLRGVRMLPGCGHWTQQERPDDVSAALVEFVRALPNP